MLSKLLTEPNASSIVSWTPRHKKGGSNTHKNWLYYRAEFCLNDFYGTFLLNLFLRGQHRTPAVPWCTRLFKGRTEMDGRMEGRRLDGKRMGRKEKMDEERYLDEKRT